MLIIDRFEGDYAVCENQNREMIDVPISKIPSNAKEGDILIDEKGSYIVDVEKTEKLRREIEKDTKNLWT